MNKSTKVELVTELQAKIDDIGDQHKEELIRILSWARAGVYHDFETMIAAPKQQLVSDLRSIGMTNLATRVINGEFDEPSPNWKLNR